MLKRLTDAFSIVAVLVIMLMLAGGANASPGDKGAGKVDLDAPHVPGQILVKFKGDVSLGTRLQVHTLQGGMVTGEIAPLGVQVVRIPAGKMVEILDGYLSDPRVAYAEPDYLAQGDFTPDDEYYGSMQYAPQQIQADLAWDITTGDPNVIVAVVDTGADFSHPDLQGKLIAGWDYVNNDRDPADDHGHGTHVSGIIAAATNNGQGVAGVGCDTRVLVVKALNQSNVGSYGNIAAGIVYAANQGAHVINLSVSGTSWSMTLWQAVEYAWGKGSLLVAAAGNENSSAAHYPAAYDHVMGVSATDVNDERWSLSNYGDYISVAAPGKGVYSTDWLGGAGPYASRSGTSQAAPHVSGVAALLVAQDPNRTNQDVWGLIESSADDLGDAGWDPYFGYGRINAYAALAGGGAGAQFTSCFPSCGETDGKFAAITSGSGYSTLVLEPLSFFVSTAEPQLDLGLFDPDISGLWDYFGSSPGDVAFRLYADPFKTGDPGLSMGLVGEWFSTNLAASDNAWFNLTIHPNSPAAFDGSQYVYLLVATQENATAVSTNAFKVGVGGSDVLELAPDVAFGFIGAVSKESDLAVLYPDWPNSLTGTTYDGLWTFNLNITAPPGDVLNEVSIWDGDLDFGDGVTDLDTDDVDTGNTTPGFNTSPDAMAQGAQGVGAPKENNDFLFQGLPVFLRDAPITYELVDPNGVSFLNSNPSGNREWELFRIRATTHASGCDDDGVADGNPLDDADFCVSSLTAGTWRLNVMGVDLSNLNFFHFGFGVLAGG